jgi:hypothetical protein
LVVIDEVQRRPDLFPILRVLIDRPRSPARFLLLGSASPALLRQSSKSLAGHRDSGIRFGGSRAESLCSLMVARRISGVICRHVGVTQLHLARGIHTNLSRTGLAAVRYADSWPAAPPLLDHAGALSRSNMERCRTPSFSGCQTPFRRSTDLWRPGIHA